MKARLEHIKDNSKNCICQKTLVIWTYQSKVHCDFLSKFQRISIIVFIPFNRMIASSIWFRYKVYGEGVVVKAELTVKVDTSRYEWALDGESCSRNWLIEAEDVEGDCHQSWQKHEYLRGK